MHNSSNTTKERAWGDHANELLNGNVLDEIERVTKSLQPRRQNMR